MGLGSPKIYFQAFMNLFKKINSKFYYPGNKTTWKIC